MRRMHVPIEIPTLMEELNPSKYLLDDSEWLLFDLVNRQFVHLQGQDVGGHGFIEVIDLIDADFLCLYYVLPQLFVEVKQGIH
jgi:hypothetical protein